MFEPGGPGPSAPVRLASLFAAMGPRTAATPPATNVEAIAAAAEARGRAVGRAEAEAELAPLLDLLRAAVGRVDAACTIDAEGLAPLFADLVGRVARAVIEGELRLSGDAVARLVATALAAVEVAGSVMVFASEADHDLLVRHSGDDRKEAPPPTFLIDPTLAPGDIRVETPKHVVTASLTARLAEIVAAL